VTAGYMQPAARRAFYRHMDAANVDLKAFTEKFYWSITKGHLQPVLDTLLYLKHETSVWFEITNLLIPGENDSSTEIEQLSRWVVDNLGPDVPLHFSAFHPDYRMTDKPNTPHTTLVRARQIARKNGIRHAYVGNVHDLGRQSTHCHHCGERTIERDWYQLGAYRLDDAGRCRACGTPCPGVFDGPPGEWGRRRLSVKLAQIAAGIGMRSTA
jgi:pyruvate formate lyase activating enzyme